MGEDVFVSLKLVLGVNPYLCYNFDAQTLYCLGIFFHYLDRMC